MIESGTCRTILNINNLLIIEEVTADTSSTEAFRMKEIASSHRLKMAICDKPTNQPAARRRVRTVISGGQFIRTGTLTVPRPGLV